MQSIKIQAYIDTKEELKKEQLQVINERLTNVFEEFAQEIGKEQTIDIGWSWWKHINVI